MQPVIKDSARRNSVAYVSLTQNNMSSEVERFRKKQMTLAKQIHKAPAKIDPNSSLRRLSITD